MLSSWVTQWSGELSGSVAKFVSFRGSLAGLHNTSALILSGKVFEIHRDSFQVRPVASSALFPFLQS